jgi:hypothetical protein
MMLTSFIKGILMASAAVVLMAGSVWAQGDPSLLQDKAVQKELRITADQTNTAGANDAYHKASQKATSNPGKPREYLNKATLAKIVALMTPAQKAIWEDLTGPPFVVPRGAPKRGASPAGRRPLIGRRRRDHQIAVQPV